MPDTRPAPDPADSYERARPSQQSGMGRLDNNKAVPEDAPDRQQEAVTNRQDPQRQVNADDKAAVQQPDHSMLEEEPDGWDQAPNDIKDPRMKRHPRTEGRGGTP